MFQDGNIDFIQDFHFEHAYTPLASRSRRDDGQSARYPLGRETLGPYRKRPGAQFRRSAQKVRPGAFNKWVEVRRWRGVSDAASCGF